MVGRYERELQRLREELEDRAQQVVDSTAVLKMEEERRCAAAAAARAALR